MTKANTTAAPTAPKAGNGAPKAPDLQLPPGLQAQAAVPAAPTAEAEKPKRAKQQEVFETEEAAVAEANSREKGPRRAFKCTLGDKVVFTVSHNEGRAGGAAFEKVGGTVEELGKAARKSKPVGVEGIMAALASLSEEERKKVEEQIASIKK